MTDTYLILIWDRTIIHFYNDCTKLLINVLFFQLCIVIGQWFCYCIVCVSNEFNPIMLLKNISHHHLIPYLGFQFLCSFRRLCISIKYCLYLLLSFLESLRQNLTANNCKNRPICFGSVTKWYIDRFFESSFCKLCIRWYGWILL